MTPALGQAVETREQAQRRADQVRAFRRELAVLDAEAALVLAPEQASAVGRYHDDLLATLATRFDVDRSQAEKQMSLGMRIASLLGALALSAAVFFFFYRFWASLAVPVQIGALVGVPILATLGIEVAARREKTLYIASLLAVVAFASFVLDLNVLAGIFNLPPSQHGFLVWGLFAFMLAYGYRLRLLLMAGIGSTGIWLAASLTSLSGAWWDVFMLRPENFIVAGLIAFLAGWREMRRGDEAFAQVYRITGWVAVLLPMLWLSEMGELSYLPLPSLVIRHCYDVLGFAAGVTAVWFGVRRQWPETTNAGTLFLAMFLCLKLYDWCWDWMPRYLFFLVIGGVAIGLIVVLQRVRARAGARR